MEDVIYAKTEDNITVLQDVVGNTTSFKGVKIVEVNVTKTRLILSYI
ncbi:CooT family nickel-binding protein [Candidatus Bathyarchaeota archaeon]|nr:CooT family nickel-binding protein [Candidatus Bathyarchaeota archaeon]MBS7630470.1 CooT family nickel-binding protein [Candidatus Bathyarchaeota archaeon]